MGGVMQSVITVYCRFASTAAHWTLAQPWQVDSKITVFDCPSPNTIYYWHHLTKPRVFYSKTDLCASDMKLISLTSEWKFCTITSHTLNEGRCWLLVQCLFQHFITLLINVKLTLVRLQHFLHEPNNCVSSTIKLVLFTVLCLHWRGESRKT